VAKAKNTTVAAMMSLTMVPVALGCSGALGPAGPLSGVWLLHPAEDVTQVSFDRIDLDQCTLSYEGTGGTSVRRWRSGQCTQQGDSLQLTGQWLGSCFGLDVHPPWCDPTDDSSNEEVSMTLEVQRIDACTVSLSGTRYEALSCD
jgi:hypothetical protein